MAPNSGSVGHNLSVSAGMALGLRLRGSPAAHWPARGGHVLGPPLDEAAMLAAARDHGVMVSVEEHNITSGFGSAVAEVLASHRAGVRLARIGMPDQFSILGPLTHLYRHYGLDAEGVAAVVRRTLQG